MRLLLAFIALGLLSACSSEEEPKADNTKPKEELEIPVDKSDLIEIDGDVYTEYYEDGKTVKFKGTQDAEKKRHGKWVYYSKSGVELSMYMYDHGKRHGHCIVKHPNGAIYYYGEWIHDQKVGIWKMYDESGKMTSEKDYGGAEAPSKEEETNKNDPTANKVAE
jgi:antitoxin component YwqK of YwqJK toxin-antitoxin module